MPKLFSFFHTSHSSRRRFGGYETSSKNYGILTIQIRMRTKAYGADVQTKVLFVSLAFLVVEKSERLGRISTLVSVHWRRCAYSSLFA